MTDQSRSKTVVANDQIPIVAYCYSCNQQLCLTEHNDSLLQQLSVDIVWRQLSNDVVCYAIIIRH